MLSSIADCEQMGTATAGDEAPAVAVRRSGIRCVLPAIRSRCSTLPDSSRVPVCSHHSSNRPESGKSVLLVRFHRWDRSDQKDPMAPTDLMGRKVLMDPTARCFLIRKPGDCGCSPDRRYSNSNPHFCGRSGRALGTVVWRQLNPPRQQQAHHRARARQVA